MQPLKREDTLIFKITQFWLILKNIYVKASLVLIKKDLSSDRIMPWKKFLFSSRVRSGRVESQRSRVGLRRITIWSGRIESGQGNKIWGRIGSLKTWSVSNTDAWIVI